MKVDICVTAYNEEANLQELIDRFLEISDMNEFVGNLIILDNGSTDSTWILLERLDALKILRYRAFSNLGYGGGIKQAIAYAKADFVAIIPADNQYNFNDISDLVTKFAALNNSFGSGVALKGRRVKRKDPISVQILSFCYSLFVSLLIGKRIKDANGLPKIFNKKLVVDLLDRFPDNACFDAILLLELINKDITLVEYPVHFYERSSGKPSWSGKRLIISFRMFVTIVRYRIIS